MNNNSLKNLNYNHTPKSFEYVNEIFENRGYKIINYTYKNNQTRMQCYDSDGYKVMVSLASLNKNIKQYQRFSVNCNLESFKFNVDLYIKNNNLNCKYLNNWRKSKINNHIDCLFKCNCGNEYWCDFNYFKNNKKDRCNECSEIMSKIALKTKCWIESKNIKYQMEYKFDDCRDIRPLPFDFYLKDLNILIEVDGEQHFEENFERLIRSGRFTIEELNDRIKKDNIKNKYCIDKNIKLIRLKYDLFKDNSYIERLEKEVYNS